MAQFNVNEATTVERINHAAELCEQIAREFRVWTRGGASRRFIERQLATLERINCLVDDARPHGTD